MAQLVSLVYCFFSEETLTLLFLFFLNPCTQGQNFQTKLDHFILFSTRFTTDWFLADESKITEAEIKFITRRAGFTTRLNYKTNLDITKKLNIITIMEFAENYKANWKKHFFK